MKASAPAAAAAHVPDVADAVHEVRAFTLADVLVPGKVTILDFWAEWCEPCTHLDAELRALAARAPDVAVRRSDIVLPESPAAATLSGASLPRVRIYDPAGRLVAETGFDLAAIEAAVAASRAAAPPRARAPLRPRSLTKIGVAGPRALRSPVPARPPARLAEEVFNIRSARANASRCASVTGRSTAPGCSASQPAATSGARRECTWSQKERRTSHPLTAATSETTAAGGSRSRTPPGVAVRRTVAPVAAHGELKAPRIAGKMSVSSAPSGSDTSA